MSQFAPYVIDVCMTTTTEAIATAANVPIPWHRWHRSLSNSLRNFVDCLGIDSFESLLSRIEDDFLDLRGFGPTRLEELRWACEEVGLSLRKTTRKL
jgi:hypothetical protein